jgi:hypothetical protein
MKTGVPTTVALMIVLIVVVIIRVVVSVNCCPKVLTIAIVVSDGKTKAVVMVGGYNRTFACGESNKSGNEVGERNGD